MPMSADLSQSWLTQVGRGGMRDTLMVFGLLAITAGAVVLSLTFVVIGVAPQALAALTFIARALTALGGFFLAVPLFLGASSEDRWSNGLRIAGLVVGFLVVLFTLIRI